MARPRHETYILHHLSFFRIPEIGGTALILAPQLFNEDDSFLQGVSVDEQVRYRKDGHMEHCLDKA
jgi:hypothetical protein